MVRNSWFFALAILLLLEATLHTFGNHFSSNIAQISDTKESIAGLGSNTNGPSILFLGSSLVGEGIDSAQAMKYFQSGTTAGKVVPDASNIWDWFCILKDATRPGRPFPTTVVIGYAWDQLTDQAELNINKSFGFFCGMSEISDLRQYADLDIEGVFEGTVSQLSMTYMLRSAIRNNSLDLIIDNYQQTTQKINQENYKPVQFGATEGPQPHFTYRALKRITDYLKTRHTKLVLVAMPTRSDYVLDAQLCRAAEELDLTALDGRNIAHLGEGDFRDPIHLNQSGKTRFTQHLARNLAEILNKSSSSTGCVQTL